VQLLAVLDQNPAATWETLVHHAEVEIDTPLAHAEIVDEEENGGSENGELATFKL